MHSSLSSQQTETGPQILVVSNDQDIHKLLYFFLKQAGYRVIVAGCAEAVTVYSANRIDLVLLDLMASPTHGLAVCQQLRCYSDIPLIVLTEVSQPDQVVQGLELGADDAIHYPFAMIEILARMQALLRRRLWANTLGDRLAGKNIAESGVASSPAWLSESLSLNNSTYASGIQG